MPRIAESRGANHGGYAKPGSRAGSSSRRWRAPRSRWPAATVPAAVPVRRPFRAAGSVHSAYPMAVLPTPVRFDLRQHGVERRVDASSWPAWTGVVPDREAHVLDFVEVLIVHRGAAMVHAAGHGMPVRTPGSRGVVVTHPGVERRVAVTDPLTVDLVVFPQRGGHRLDVPTAVSGISGVAAVTPVDAAELTAVGRLLRHELEAGLDDAPAMLAALLAQFVVRLRRAWPAGARRTPPTSGGSLRAAAGTRLPPATIVSPRTRPASASAPTICRR